MAFFPYLLRIGRARLPARKAETPASEEPRVGTRAQLHHTLSRSSLRRAQVRPRRRESHGYRAAPAYYSWIQAGGMQL